LLKIFSVIKRTANDEFFASFGQEQIALAGTPFFQISAEKNLFVGGGAME